MCFYHCEETNFSDFPLEFFAQIAALPTMKTVLDSLHAANINYEVYDNVRVEPTDERYACKDGILTVVMC